MGRNKLSERRFRRLQRNNTGTTTVSLPIEMIRKLGWKQGTRVSVSRRGKKLVIEED